MRYPWLVLLLALWTCGAAAAAELILAIEPRWGSAALTVPSAEVKNDAGQTLRVTRLAGLISGVVLARADGSTVRLEGQYGYFDAERGWREILLRGVPAGDYIGFEFQIGVPPSVNHADVARWPAGHALNPLTTGLHWSWQGGYVFLALEGKWHEGAPGEERGFLYHLATDARAMTIGFAANYRVETHTRVALAFDVSRMLRGQKLASDDGSESTHSGEGDEVAVRLGLAAERAWFWLGAEETKAGSATDAIALEGTASEQNAGADPLQRGTPLAFAVPAGFPQPELPGDNPLTVEGVALGRRLFHDPRLSSNGTQSCASCHAPERGFAEARPVSIGALGKAGVRNAMPLFNLAWSHAYAWDGGQSRVRDQSLAALRNPLEMNGDLAAIVAALARDGMMRSAFAAAFGDGQITAERVGLALEQYLLTLVSADSKFDRALRGEATLSEAEKRGFELFLTEYDPARGKRGADCFHCHGGALFTDFGFKNNGLALAGPRGDRGRAMVTKAAGDEGRFKTPSLRNVALTAPYMHDGRLASLEDVVAHYDHGAQRSPTLDPNLAKHPASGMRLPPEDQAALVAFLRALTDETLAKR